MPGGEANITTCIEDPSDATGPGGATRVCSLESTVLVREANKPSFSDVTQELTSFFSPDDNKRHALFEIENEDWLWQYDNKGLRLAQLRFYFVD